MLEGKNISLSNSSKSVDGNKDQILDVLQVSKGKYEFNPRDDVWELDKDNTVYLYGVDEYISENISDEFRKVLVQYAKNKSGAYVSNITKFSKGFLEQSSTGLFDYASIVSYRSKLNSRNEYKLGYIRSFLKQWYESKYPGIEKDAYELLCGLKLKGNVKGERVQLLDAEEGPLSDIELASIHERAYQEFRLGNIGVQDIAELLINSHIGCRPKQISDLKIDDLKQSDGASDKGFPGYFINLPSAKKGLEWRDSFHLYPVTDNLWNIVQDQSENVVGQCKRLFPDLSDDLINMLPLFPNFKRIEKVASISEFKDLLEVDVLHLSRKDISKNIKKVVDSLSIISERTGKKLNFFSTRFRYTVGSNLSREGYGSMAIAEALDHSDNQNSHVYTKNNPVFIKKLDEAIGRMMVPVAQAFSGRLVDNEEEAVNGDNRSKRIRIDVDASSINLGSCGEHGFCSDHSPIACYTCNLFQPWLDAPHNVVLDFLIEDRERMYEVTGDERVTSILDRTILAVVDVIKQCHERKIELSKEVVKLEVDNNE